MPAPNVSELIATTLRARSGKLADNITNNLALLYMLRKGGNIRTFSGGRTIIEEIEYDENQTFGWYNGYERLDVQPSEVFTAAEFTIKQAALSVSISGLELLQNAGREQVIPLISSRVKNGEKTFMNRMGAAVYSDGTGSGAKEIGGLRHLVSDTGLGTIGGIDANTWGFWQNHVYDFSAKSVTAGPSTIQSAMLEMYTSVCRNTEHPDVVIADNIFYRHYVESLTPNQRHANASMADAGFKTVEYMGMPVVLDGGKGGSAPASHMYMLNLDYLAFRPHKDRNIVPLGEKRQPLDQDAQVQFMGFAGNMTISNRSVQAVAVL